MNSTPKNADSLVANGDVLSNPKTFKELVADRIVATHDSHGIPFLFGSRAERRKYIKNHGTSTPKQYHKQGHN